MLVLLIVLNIFDVILGYDTSSKPYYSTYYYDAIDYFEDFIKTYNKNYANEYEKEKRFDIFQENLQEINNLNWENEHAVFDINAFSDLTKEEFVNKFTGLNQKDFRSTGCDCLSFTDKDVKTRTAPKYEFDWRDHNVVTGNKNQKYCGACWAISTTEDQYEPMMMINAHTSAGEWPSACNHGRCKAFETSGMIEGQLAIKHNKLVPLSAQQLLDCVDGSGCSGGHPSSALSKLIEQGGQMLQEDYPYLMRKKNCEFDFNKVVVNVTECHEFNLKKQRNLRELLFTRGPLVVRLDMQKLLSYKGGIVKYSECSDEHEPNHAVLLVGYGKEKGVRYWILKNSFQNYWGENGYFRLEYGKNTCGMMTFPVLTAVID